MSIRRPVKRSIISGGVALALVAGLQVALLATPATAATNFNVTTTADIATNAGACGNTAILTAPNPASLSLREAVCLANNNGGTATINIPGGTYTLTTAEVQVGTHSGQNVTLSGAGAATTIISGNNAHRVLDFDPNVIGGIAGTVSGVTVTGGNDSVFGGAGIIGGSAAASSPDSLTVTNSIVTNNSANTSSPASTNVPGGGIQVIGGSLSISNTTISNNSSHGSEGAGVYYEAVGTASPESLTISGSTFTGNTMTSPSGGLNNGGALYVAAPASISMQVSESSFVNNSVVASGSNGAWGAAIYQESGTLTVSESTFTGNSVTAGGSQNGGAIANVAGATTLHYNRFTGNVATTGQALFVGTSAGTVNATENWWGCNGGPGSTGCDTVAAAPPATATLSPRLVFNASPGSSTLTGPNATTSVTGSFTTDSLGAAVSGANLSAFNGKSVSFTDPQPSPATVSSPSANFATDTGTSSVTYNSQTSSGAGHVVVGFDNASVTVPITVDRAPVVTTNPSNQSVLAGNTASFTAAASGFPTPSVQWQVSTNGGTSYSNASGASATSTTYSFTAAQGDNGNKYRAVFTNSVNTATTTAATLTVGSPPTFTSGNTATFKVGTAGPTFTITTSGTPTVTSIGESGTLPTGLTFHDNGDGTATISGTPAAGTAGTYPITLTATNGVAPDATQNLGVQVNQAPAITQDPSDQTKNPGASVSFTAAASGVPTPTVQWQVSTNGGASYSNASGASATSTTYTFTTAAGDNGNKYRAVFTNSVDTATTTAATLSVGTAPSFTSGNTTTFTVGTAGNFGITTSGVPNATITAGGQVPSWLTLTDNGDGTGSLTGTPPVGAGGTYTFTLHATNGFSPAASQIFTLSVNEAPTITSTNNATFTVGSAGSFGVTTNPGHPTATAITETGGLPSGVTLVDNGDGTATLAGTPAAGTSGSYPIVIHANATGGTTSPRNQTFTLTVDGPPLITSADHTTFTVGTAGTFTVATSAGNPTTTTISKTGALPSGVTFVDNGTGTATLSGTPAANTGGSYPLTITASNGINPDSVQTFTLTVNQPPTITSANNKTFTKGAASSFTVTTAPGVPASTTISESGALPTGITLTDNGDGTATLGGTPTASGVFPITIKAGNGVAPDASQSFTLTVNGAPTISSTDHATFTVGTAGTFTVTTTAGTPASTTLTKTGTLPSGVTFVDNTNGTATLAGTPAADTGGSYPITITASNTSANSQQSFTLTVDQPPTITSLNHATFKVGTAGTFTVSTAGFPLPALSKTGALPTGVTFVDNNNGTATLAGTPAAGSGGSYPITIAANNGVAPNATQPFTLTVNDPPKITSGNNATFAVGTSGTFTVTTTAGTPASTVLTESGPLPSGVTFVDNSNGTATLAGTPAAGSGGSYPITITASNGVTPNATQAFTLTVTELPAITSADNTTFEVGAGGTFTVTTTAGFPASTTLTKPAGALPSGVTFTDNGNGTATLAGTPAAGSGGSYPLTIRAANTAGHTDQTFTLTVRESPGITSADHTTFTTGTAGTFTVTTGVGFPTPPTLTETGTLPAGVTFTDNGDGTATLAGTPPAGTGGPHAITIKASNGVNPDASQSFTLTVDEAPAITSADHATLTIGTNGSFAVVTTGYPIAGLTEVGALPTGVTFVDNGDGTATLGGTPAAATNGPYPFTITASNGVNPPAVQSFTLTVVKAAQTITITSTPPANPTVNSPDYTVVATSTSNLTVAFSIDASTTNSACSISGATVSFDHTGTCVIDANQAGDSTYLPAPQVQQTLPVSAIATAVSVVSSTSPTVFGQAAHATATITADSGTPAGSVQFAVDGTNLGPPVTVTGGQAVSDDLTGSGGGPLAPGAHPVTATFTPTDTTTYAGSSDSVTQVVNKASTTTRVAVHSTTITATVAAVAPGAGTPSGSVAFSVGGASVGSAPLVNGVATLHRSVPAGQTRHVAASYGGDTDFTGSSDSTARHDPTIRAHISSAHAKTKFGWYRTAVTITFTCTTNGAPLTKPCPSAVHLTHNGAGQSVTRTISATDGGMDTVVVKNLNLDQTKPKVRVAGVKNGATYDTPPKLRCVAKDALSGVASCKLTRHTSGDTTTYRAVATDKAGNKRTVTGSYHSQAISIQGANLVDGAYNVKLGHTYTLVVHSIKQPTYYDAAPVPTTPFVRDQVFHAAGKHRWALGVTMEQNLHHYKYWNLGVKIGGTMHVIRIRVS